MIEIDFKDRVPNHPGRIELIPVEGQPNIFDMARADDPLDVGTPINKALLQSITHSRLTGRFYAITPNLTIKSTTKGTVSPLPSSGWFLDGLTTATSGSYKVVASTAINSDYSVEKALDTSASTSWAGNDNTTHTYTMIFPNALKIKKIGLLLGESGDTSIYLMTVQGSNNGTNWTNLLTVSDFPYGETVYTLTTTGEYSQYRLHFETRTATRMYIYKIALPEWETNTYTIDFTSYDMPAQWDTGQRVTVQIPTYASFVVASNTFNGIKVNTILLSGRKYELVYNGSSFDAKEV